MATDYTTQEIATLSGAVMLTGLAISIVDAGIVSTAIEAAAMAKEVSGAAKKYPNNSVIQALFSPESPHSDPTKTTKIDVQNMKQETAVETAIAKINEAVAILTAKNTPEEVQEFKEFVYHCGEVVAKAAGSGLFGSGNPKVSDKEAQALTQIKTALGV